ncbi:uncharacterized protein C8R40DRAFT_1075476 [Lentinula edodes]|uniref:uncharacterized protein n=1 Tax=Lentinula edodes TaxID=5353 RepID=UPI001E8DABF9|nr:uncharacterized protein C8R40DRAFT_1075476 [Lentinula edodes]KAH7867601.1 hypothetical protein C8R40DRAFT_1075476 [Lentinula edodes]
MTDPKELLYTMKPVHLENSHGTFTETAIDIEVLIKQLRREIFKSEVCVEERNQHNLQQDQQELRSLLKDIKGAGVGPNNEMISPPSSAFFATGSSIDDPIDVDFKKLILLFTESSA